MVFFKIEVPNKVIPSGTKTDDGEMVWIHKDKVLDSQYELMDDLNYCFKDIVENKSIFFITASVNDQQKISNIDISKLNK